MSKRPRKRYKKELKRTFSRLGQLRAEDDPDLSTYFVGNRGYLDRALDREDPAMIFRGPKGIGKSAILRMVEFKRQHDKDHLIRISPDDLAFTAFANVHAETPILRAADKYQWLFKSLWSYVISINLLSREYPISNTLLDRISSIFSSKDLKLARRLINISLDDHGNPNAGFTSTVLKLVSEIGLAMETQGGTISGSVKLDGSRMEKDTQLHLLDLVNRVSSSLPDLLHHDYYILIDDLDLHWSNEHSQNALIAALFSAMSKMSRTRKIKFVVSIRDDIYGFLPVEDKDKSRDWFCDIGWDKPSLRELLEQRLRVLHGISPTVLWRDLMPAKAFDRFIANTLARPRPLLRLVQLAIEHACNAGHSAVENDDIEQAIRAASKEKLDELDQEKRHLYPGIRWIVEHFSGQSKQFDLAYLKNIAENIALEIDDNQAPAEAKWAEKFYNDPRSFAWCLIDAGFLLVKTGRQPMPQEIARKNELDVLSNPWFAIRPVYTASLRLRNT